MPVQILILTSHLPFGDLVRLSLETGGSYRVRLCHSPVEALASLQRSAFGVALVDLQTPDPALMNFCRLVREIYPDLRLVVFPPGNDPSSTRLQEISFNAVLRKPFYLPDLLKVVGDQADAAGEAGVTAASPAWQMYKALPQAGRAGTPEPVVEMLRSLSREPGAAAALISSGGNLHACASRLSEAACRELADVTGRVWDTKRHEEVARFERLRSVEGQYLLYAVALPGNAVLTLAYDEGTPMSRVRLRAVRLAEQMGRIWQPRVEESSDTLPVFEDIPEPDPKAAAAPQAEGWVHEADGSALVDTQILPLVESRAVEARGAQVYSDANQAEASLVTVDDVIQPEGAESISTGAVGPVQPEAVPTDPAAPETSNAKTQPVKAVRARPYAAKAEAPGAHPVDAGRWQPETAVSERVAYTCALIPRLPHHFLTRPLAGLLNRWMPQLCEASGWSLEGLTVRPNYFTFTVQLDAARTADHMIDQVRQHTSEYIFSEYPNLAAENKSGDFWAPEELVAPGTLPLPLAQLSRFMIAARQTVNQPVEPKSEPNQHP